MVLISLIGNPFMFNNFTGFVIKIKIQYLLRVNYKEFFLFFVVSTYSIIVESLLKCSMIQYSFLINWN